MIVCKFGGSSLADAAHVKKVAEILTSDETRKVVVVSAPGKRDKSDQKVTDMLYECDALVRKGESCGALFASVRDRYTSIIRDLDMPATVLDEALDEAGDAIERGAGPDYAASRGEYLNARLMAAYLGWTFVDAVDLVMIEDDDTVADESYDRIVRMIADGNRYVIPGFYGSSREGKVKTFSRGGSDISGSIVARAVGATLYENWTDVSGVFMADPRIVADARVIRTMTYHEVRELAAVGFSVFHEEAIAPVRQAGIPIQVKNTNKPQDTGTSIVSIRESGKDPVIGVSVKNGYGRIAVQKLLLFKRLSVRSHMEQALRTLGVVPEFTFSGIDSLVWYFPVSKIADGLLDTVALLLKEQFVLDDAVCETGFSVAAITGEGLMDTKRVATSLWPALADKGIDVRFLSYGASSITCLIGIPESQAQLAVETMYDAVLR